MPERPEDNAAGQEQPPSKSARKRHMLHLQALGESLLPLNDRQLEQLPIEDQELLSVIRECREIRSNSARKRHLQYIGKLMRHIDSTALEQALLELHSTHQQGVAEFHDLEQLREDILSAGISGVELAMTRFPEADRQQLRQFILQHQREIQRQKPPAASRKLFRYLKELHDTYGESG